jgi:Iap family predicted aminopeptidase
MILPVANRDHVGHLTAEEKVEWAILDTFDWYSAKYDKPQNWKAVESILLTMNYEINRTQRRGLHGRRKK